MNEGLNMFKRLLGVMVVMQLMSPVYAADNEIPPDELKVVLRTKIHAVERLAANSVVIEAVRAQNGQHLTMPEIKKRDDEWQATKELTAFKKSLQDGPAGEFLKQSVRRNPTYGEAFLTDNQGANVAAFPATSDYWQGDEEKWSASWNKAQGKVYIGPVKFDESSKTHAAQISAPVIDRGQTIGVLVVGVTIDYIDWKKNQGRRRY
jgi:hypothetical protein